jgi:signal transduction histidine kinase
MSFGSLRLRLLLGAAAFILAAVLLSAIGLTILFERHVERWIDEQLNAHLNQLIAGVDVGPANELTVTRPPVDPRFDRQLSGLYWQVAVQPSGPILRSRSLWDDEIDLPIQNTDGLLNNFLVAGPGGQTLYLVQRRVELPARLGAKTIYAAVALDRAEVRSSVLHFATALIPFLLILGAALTTAAWVQVTVGLRPLAAMRRKLEEIGSGTRRRLGTGFPDEIQPLAEQIDVLLDERDRQIEKARTRATDLAHGLKTPLQVLVSDAEQLKAQGQTKIAEEIEEISKAMQRHVDRQLARTRLAAYDMHASTNVGEVVEGVVRVMERTLDGQRLTWTINVPGKLNARIDREDLAEAIGNLAENAARHASSRVAISARTEAEFVTVTMADDGPGIIPDRQQKAFSRGGRLDQAGPGAGLGLAIVKDITDAWGGKLWFDTPGSGLHVCLSVPIATAR